MRRLMEADSITSRFFQPPYTNYIPFSPLNVLTFYVNMIFNVNEVKLKLKLRLAKS